MAIYTSGRDTTPGAQTHLRGLIPGHDYVFQYKAPGFAFMLLGSAVMSALVQGWVNLRKSLDDQNSDEVLTVTGVSVNTGTGDIFMRGFVADTSAVVGAGVNPYAVAAVLASLFAAIGIGVTLLYVYEVAQGQ